MFDFDFLITAVENSFLRRSKATVGQIKVHRNWISIFLRKYDWRVRVGKRLILPAVTVELRSLFIITISFGYKRNNPVRVMAAVALGVETAARVTFLEV